ncbi:MAG: CehA/McbA family metallohydrolase [Clostridiales bacterium]|nr:CehA/McbA family metallohydrolase [Clostridiales bacterium]
MKIFSDGKAFYKGNLHTHTRLSDGRKTPEEAVALYRAGGYDFIAITDHRKRFPGLETEDFVVLPGGEYHHQPGVTAYHILGIGTESDVVTDDSTSPQEIIDRIRSAGGYPILAHPAWSLMTAEDGLALRGYEAVEIYNGISDGYANRGYSSEFIDACATHGRLTAIVADDDAHFYEGYDELRGFICVQADSLTIQGLMDAIWAGKYYASTGPSLSQIEIDDAGVFHVTCSAVREIYFMTNTWFVAGRTVRAPKGETITSASYKPVSSDRWVRVEGVDENGGRFYSNFIPISRG